MIIVETNLTSHKFQDLYYVSCRYFGLKPFVKTKRVYKYKQGVPKKRMHRFYASFQIFQIFVSCLLIFCHLNQTEPKMPPSIQLQYSLIFFHLSIIKAPNRAKQLKISAEIGGSDCKGYIQPATHVSDVSRIARISYC